jgi:hypothetical protein
MWDESALDTGLIILLNALTQPHLSAALLQNSLALLGLKIASLKLQLRASFKLECSIVWLL